jgi:hypothetical protein
VSAALLPLHLNDSRLVKIEQELVSFLDATENKKPKPARIPPQTPPARGRDRISETISRIFANPFPQKICFAKIRPFYRFWK